MKITYFVILMVFGINSIAYADSIKHSVNLPIVEPEQLTCRWWNANKNTVKSEAVAAIGVAFLQGYEAGHVGAKNIEFNSMASIDNSSFLIGFPFTYTVPQIDEYCVSKPHEAWPNSLLGIYLKSKSTPPSPPVSPRTK